MREIETVNLPGAILFDMDGTLTRPLLDFPQIKNELGIENQPILESIEAMDPAARNRAWAALERHEDAAAERSTLNNGCREILDWLHRRNIPIALITRNSRRCARIVLERHRLSIEIVITREETPYKPSPVPLQRACERLNVGPSNAWMVGDGYFDIEAANAAAISSVWLSHGRTRSFAATPWKTVADLIELADLLKSRR